MTSFPLNSSPYGQNAACTLLPSLLSAAKAPRPLVCAMPAWIRPASRQSAHTPRAVATVPVGSWEQRSRRVVKQLVLPLSEANQAQEA